MFHMSMSVVYFRRCCEWAKLDSQLDLTTWPCVKITKMYVYVMLSMILKLISWVKLLTFLPLWELNGLEVSTSAHLPTLAEARVLFQGWALASMCLNLIPNCTLPCTYLHWIKNTQCQAGHKLGQSWANIFTKMASSKYYLQIPLHLMEAKFNGN